MNLSECLKYCGTCDPSGLGKWFIVPFVLGLGSLLIILLIFYLNRKYKKKKRNENINLI